MRATTRITNVHRGAIARLMTQLGGACAKLADEKVRGLSSQRIECDEIWSYVGKKQRHRTSDDNPAEAGDFWTWVALDADNKLVASYRVGKRTGDDARAFMADLASRVSSRIQISTDGLSSYVDAVEHGFGGDVDYAMIVKEYEAEPVGAGRYSPPKVVATEKTIISGKPDTSKISTSYVERQNLTMRMCMRRFTRLTNAFSKKVEMLRAAVAMHFANYNFCRLHQTLRCTPAMASGVDDRKWSIGDLLDYSGVVSG
ncbi:MAG: IS1 family transposase [Planctomycetota bacterium]